MPKQQMKHAFRAVFDNVCDNYREWLHSVPECCIIGLRMTLGVVQIYEHVCVHVFMGTFALLPMAMCECTKTLFWGEY